MKKKILIVADIVGWIVEDMALNIIKVLGNEFDFTLQYADTAAKELGKDVFSWNNDYNNFDLLYIMIPSFIDRLKSVSKVEIITTFHGGPATEGQGNRIHGLGGQSLKMSYVSHQTRNRISRNSFANLFFTPHGVNIEDYKQDNIKEDFVCGYAGWCRYLLNAQREHRRGYWIMEAQKALGFDLSIAAGIPKYEKDNVKVLKAAYPSNNIKTISYEHDQMQDFYSGISCYLVPDKFAGGPMPVLEAGSMGIPVICTAAGLCGDIIEDGVHGKRVNTYEEFVNAIVWMRDHPEERKQMGKNLQDYIRKNRTWEAVAPDWSDFLNGVKS